MKRNFFCILIILLILTGCAKGNMELLKETSGAGASTPEHNIELPKYIEDYMDEHGYNVISEYNKPVFDVTEQADLLELPKMQIWSIQSVAPDQYLGEYIEYYSYIVTNHKLEGLGDLLGTQLYLMVLDETVIGGYSLPNNSEVLYGGVYSEHGDTLEEITGITYEEWLKAWDTKYETRGIHPFNYRIS